MDENTLSHQYLTFTLGDEHFAIGIAKVREVLDFTDITKVPRTPDIMRGVINLRGHVLPVVDLKQSLGMSAVEKTVDTCIVVVEAEIDSQILSVGMLADSVQEVIDIDPTQVEPTPRLGTRMNTDFLCGMGKHGDRFLMILDIDKVLSADEAAAELQASTDTHGRIAA